MLYDPVTDSWLCIPSQITIDYQVYTLPQQKGKFNVPIFHGALVFPTLIQGHVDFVKWS